VATVPTDAAAGAPPLLIAFVGQSVFFRQCALERPAGGLEPVFLDFRSGAPPEPLLAELLERDPDVVLVFRPEIIPDGLFQAVRALTIGYLTEPLPRGRDSHDDLRGRMKWLRKIDPSNFDRIISFDPLIAESASSVVQVWHSLPIPVSDTIYMNVRPRAEPPRILFIGRSTEHREQLLEPIKRAYPLVHIGHGLFGEALIRFFGGADVQLNLHNNPYPTFENRVCLALAAGHLVISEPLSPENGLEAGKHYLTVETPERLLELVDELARDSAVYADVQHAGRALAERFRASEVYPQLVGQARDDVAMNGGRRT
jgi:hypothetical protein